MSASVPENTPTTEKLVMVKATDSDSEDNPVTISLGGVDASHFSLEPSPGAPLERDLKFTIVPDYENPQDSNEDNVYVVVVTATSGTGDRYRETTKTITITVTNVQEPGDAASATVEITDNDEPDEVETKTDTDVVTKTDTDVETKTDTDVAKSDVTVSFAATRYEASEDNAALRFAVQLSTASRQEVTVQYATASGTAKAGRDYQVRRGTLTFPAGTTDARRSACLSSTTT